VRSARAKRTFRAPSSLNRALKCNFSDLVVKRFVPQEAERYDVARASSTKTHQGYVIVRRTEFNSPDSAFAAIGAKVRNGLYRAAKEYKGEEETNMDQQDKLRAKLVEYVQNVHAMEQ
jgi:hypothetical protein